MTKEEFISRVIKALNAPGDVQISPEEAGFYLRGVKLVLIELGAKEDDVDRSLNHYLEKILIANGFPSN